MQNILSMPIIRKFVGCKDGFIRPGSNKKPKAFPFQPTTDKVIFYRYDNQKTQCR